MTHQNGYTMANLSARKQFDEGVVRTIGANISRAISGDTGDDKTLSGGAMPSSIPAMPMARSILTAALTAM
jgi:hypothetical protein